MIKLILALSLIGLAATLALWRRERSPFGHGLEAPASRPIMVATPNP